MKNKKNIAIASLVVSILSAATILISPSSMTGTLILIVTGVILAIVGTVLGFIGKKEAKGFAISGIVIGILSCILLCFSLIGVMAIQAATDCVDNGNGVSTCNYLGQELEVPTGMLTEEQMKK